jgi:hypothetical protein
VHLVQAGVTLIAALQLVCQQLHHLLHELWLVDVFEGIVLVEYLLYLSLGLLDSLYLMALALTFFQLLLELLSSIEHQLLLASLRALPGIHCQTLS